MPETHPIRRLSGLHWFEKRLKFVFCQRIAFEVLRPFDRNRLPLVWVRRPATQSLRPGCLVPLCIVLHKPRVLRRPFSTARGLCQDRASLFQGRNSMCNRYYK